MSETAFELDETGALRRCEWVGGARKVALFAPVLTGPWHPITKRERRTWARRGTRGRRGARRVLPVRRDVPLCAPVREDRAHRFSDGRVSVWLYLPSQDTPTDAHAAMLDAAMRKAR